MLTVWTIYNHPHDHPSKWVLRAHDVTPEGGTRARADFFTADTLDLIRSYVPAGLYRLPRDPHDDPVIYETWI